MCDRNASLDRCVCRNGLFAAVKGVCPEERQDPEEQRKSRCKAASSRADQERGSQAVAVRSIHSFLVCNCFCNWNLYCNHFFRKSAGILAGAAGKEIRSAGIPALCPCLCAAWKILKTWEMADMDFFCWQFHSTFTCYFKFWFHGSFGNV